MAFCPVTCLVLRSQVFAFVITCERLETGTMQNVTIVLVNVHLSSAIVSYLLLDYYILSDTRKTNDNNMLLSLYIGC